MKCELCKKLFPNSLNSLCFTCNKVICDECDAKYIGIPKFRYFMIDDIRYCFNCFSNKKYAW